MTSPGASRAHTRGFLFADLRDYSAYTEIRGDSASAELIGRYRRLVREAIAAFEGAEIRTEGDSFYVVFDSVSDAVQAGVAIRDAAVAASSRTPDAPIRVGIGIHAGESTDGEEGIISSAVNTAARVCSIARPGQVLVTDTVRALTRTFLPMTFHARGRHRLKGIIEPIAVFAVERTSTPTRQPRGVAAWGNLAAWGGAAVVLVVIVALAWPRPGGLQSVADSTSPTNSPPLASADPTHDLSRYTDPGKFPNALETALLDRLPSVLAGNCGRAEPADTPLFYFPAHDTELAGTMALGVTAAVDCITGDARVRYWQASGSPGGADELLFNVVLKQSLKPGSCDERPGVYEEWSAGAHAGHVLCYRSDGSAVIEWSYADDNVYAIAVRRDGDLDALVRWWRDIGRLLTRA